MKRKKNSHMQPPDSFGSNDHSNNKDITSNLVKQIQLRIRFNKKNSVYSYNENCSVEQCHLQKRINGLIPYNKWLRVILRKTNIVQEQK